MNMFEAVNRNHDQIITLKQINKELQEEIAEQNKVLKIYQVLTFVMLNYLCLMSIIG